MTEEEKKRRGLKPNMSFGREVADTNGFDTATLREQPSEVIPTVSEQPAEPQTTATEQPQPSAYDRLMAAYEERQQKDERADKRDRIREAIAGIGDTVGALGNLYFTTKYASPIPQTEGMSDKMRERYEAAKANRDRRRAEWMNYALNIAGRKQAAEQAEANRKENSRQFNDRMDFYKEQEQRRKDEFEFKQQKEQWRQDFEQKKLDQKEKLAIMNADLKKWSERLKMSRSEIAHTLAGYTIDEYEYRDEQGRKHKVKMRTVYNPKTEQLEAKETDEVEQPTQQGNDTNAPYVQQSTNRAPYLNNK